MSNTFFEKSKEIANDFIQSIVFLDDKAYKDPNKDNPAHDLDILKISQAFAKQNKICATYRPESISDINNFKLIANKADVIVLDWQIEFSQVVEPGTEEEDAPADEPRGIYTKEIIKSIIFEENYVKNSLKLIIVYTGDIQYLKAISEEIYVEVFDSSAEYNFDSDNHIIQSSHFKILVRAKSAEVAFEANKDKLEKYMVNYEGLPAFILTEFTQMTSGLLSNFALMSLTTLRKNSSKILGLFSKEMDSAYLSHKSLLPRQEDAEDLLVEMFGDIVSDLLFYYQAGEMTGEMIEDWVKLNIINEEQELLIDNEKSHTPIQKYNRTQDLLLDLLTSPDKNIEKRYKDVFNNKSKISKSKIGDSFEVLSLNNTKLFLNSDEQGNKEKIDQMFSKLTHHKSLFIPNNTIPKLTLGTIVRSSLNENNYYICIQQKCDSVRIAKDKERKFLFIPLVKSNKEFSILTPDGIKLKKVKHSYSIRTIKFVCFDNSGVIFAKNENGKFVFKQKYTSPEDEQFEWILDLKDLHSQRIIIDYTSQLSRVGLDESEWHRKHLS